MKFSSPDLNGTEVIGSRVCTTYVKGNSSKADTDIHIWNVTFLLH